MTKRLVRLTKQYIEAVELPEGQDRLELRDDEIKSLSLWVGSTRKTWRVRKWSSQLGKRISYVLGEYPAMTPQVARQKALAVLQVISEGKDPNNYKRSHRDANAIHLYDVYSDYISSRELSASSLSSMKTTVVKHSAEVLHKPLSVITEDYVKEKHASLSKRSKSMADSWARTIRALFNFAMFEYRNEQGEKLFRENPVIILKHMRRWNNVPRKTSYISRSELPKWLSSVRAMQTVKAEEIEFEGRTAKWTEAQYMRSVGDALELALLTGLRKNEVLRLPISQVDLDNDIFIISEGMAKNGFAVELPITDYTRPIFERRLADNPFGSPYVFSCSSKSGCMVDPKKHLMNIGMETGVKFAWHDLRRTFQTASAIVGNSLYIQKRLMNHKQSKSDVTEGYTILTAEELREPACRVQSYLLGEHKPMAKTDNIIELLSEAQKEELFLQLMAEKVKNVGIGK